MLFVCRDEGTQVGGSSQPFTELFRSLGLLGGLRTHMEKSGASQTERPLDNLLSGIPFGLSKEVYQNH